MFRRRTPRPAPIYPKPTVAEQQEQYLATFGTLAGIDWELRYEQERNRGGV